MMSSGKPTMITFRDVLYSPNIAYHLFSLRSSARGSNSCESSEDVILPYLKKGGVSKFHTSGNLNRSEAIRVPPDHAHAILDPLMGPISTNRTCDAHLFDSAFGHQHKVLLRETAKSLNVELTVKIKPRYGCSMDKGLRKSTLSSSRTRPTSNLERVYEGYSVVSQKRPSRGSAMSRKGLLHKIYVGLFS